MLQNMQFVVKKNDMLMLYLNYEVGNNNHL